MARAPKSKTPFYRFSSSPEIIRLVVAYLLAERGIDICHETVRFW
jgi:putative transposase